MDRVERPDTLLLGLQFWIVILASIAQQSSLLQTLSPLPVVPVTILVRGGLPKTSATDD